MKTNNLIITFTILLAIILMSIGYAALNTNLQISGSVYVSASPGVRIISNELNKVSSAYETYPPSFTQNTITNYSTTQYGTSSIEYRVGIENTTSTTYFIESIKTLIDDNPNMFYTLKGISNYQIINPGETIYFTITIKPSGYYNIQSETLSLEFTFTESYIFEDNTLNGADPELVFGLVPIEYQNNGTLKKADINSNWYSYLDKQWANAILVTEETRKYYDEASAGTKIEEEDILGYYVWVPRFEYQIFNTTQESVDKTTTSIRFVSKDTPLVSSTELGSFVTHEAFMYDGSPLSGIWVGKFETTGTLETPTILPNQTAIKTSISSLFQSNIKFSGGVYDGDLAITYEDNSYYGLTAASESRMLKESEWGAISLLSNSIYGNATTIWNNASTITGCGGTSVDDSNKSTCINGFGTIDNDSYTQSTTGNIYGIFDMAGGSWDYTMGTYENTISSSGFTSTWLSNNQKFYTNISSNYLENLGLTQLETLSWDSDLYVPPTQSIPWSIRGNNNAGSQASGIFAVGNTRGNANNASRNVIINVPILD